MALNLVSMMSRRYSSVFNQSGFLTTAGSILEQRQDLNLQWRRNGGGGGGGLESPLISGGAPLFLATQFF